jgi:crotonobetainyl-CoA:carnitine CoA-transferase CaiB-like acyl-CoA transferase
MLKTCFLKKDWDVKLALSIMTMLMKSNHKFSNWVQLILAINNCLLGTKLHLEDHELIKWVYGLLCEKLCNWVDKKSELLSDSNFKEYRKAVTEIDEFRHACKEEYSKNDNNDLQKRITELEQMLKVVTSSSGALQGNSFAKGQSQVAKHSASTGNSSTNTFTYSHPYYASQPTSGKFIAVSAMASSSWKPGTCDVDPPPKLTNAKKQILQDNEGC